MTLLADWLQTLGTATLGALWVPLLAWTAVAFAAMSLLRLWRSAHTLVHYTTRTALLLALPLGLLLAAVTDLSILALFPSPAAETPIEPIFILPLMDFNLAPGAPAAPAWTLYHLLGLLTMLAGVLAAGRLYYLARHALALTRFRKRLPRHLDAPIQQAVDRQAAALGIQRRVRAVVTAQDVVPMTLGWLRPVIVVPEALTGDEEHLHMTLLHELIHIRRQDVLLQGVEYVIGALFLINPAVWFLRRSIGQYREMSCDAEVVMQPRVSSKRYAALLYRFASPPSFCRRLVLSMSASDHELKKRILAMKSHIRSAHRWRSPKFIGFALAALLLTSATAFVACSDLVGSNVAVDEAAAAKAEMFTVVEEMPELIG
ncbi:MAG: M56 family metallopeptidase, partial [Bacteroidetes bacterium]|nr:M56 family metallopeptidase [Bacteroidota bacterium]